MMHARETWDQGAWQMRVVAKACGAETEMTNQGADREVRGQRDGGNGREEGEG